MNIKTRCHISPVMYLSQATSAQNMPFNVTLQSRLHCATSKHISLHLYLNADLIKYDVSVEIIEHWKVVFTSGN